MSDVIETGKYDLYNCIQYQTIFKDGDPADPLNYRGITLLSVVGKTYVLVLSSRLLGWLKDNESIQVSRVASALGEAVLNKSLFYAKGLGYEEGRARGPMRASLTSASLRQSLEGRCFQEAAGRRC